ncbi:MAG: hypothetical protein AAFQ94_09675 [Bacteroidota bacterium]
MSRLSLEEIIQLASDQFHIKNAGEEISPTSELDEVFAPPHHGPRNVPIEATPVDHGDNFTHFPIVNSGTYYLFLPHETESVEVFDMHYNGPSQRSPHYPHIELEELPKGKVREGKFKQGFKSKHPVIFNQSDPQPIAIHFSVREDDEDFVLRYIVVATYDE